jgi:hypothetical protein
MHGSHSFLSLAHNTSKEHFKMATIIQHQINLARPLGGLEHFFSLIDQHRSVHFSMAAQIEGPTTISSWRAALDALQERHPQLSVGIEVAENGTPHFRQMTNAPIPLRIARDTSLSNWPQEIANELATPFDPRQAPLVRSALIHGEDESVFILTAHHSIADGLSLAYAVRDTLQALCGETLDALSPMPAQEMLVYASQEETHTIECPVQPASPPGGRPIGFRTTLDGSLPNIDTLRLTPEFTANLVERSRKERTTVHGALCAAIALAGREACTDWTGFPVRILSPVNLRKQLGIDEDCGLFVWAGIVPIEPNAHFTFWDIARYAKDSLTSKHSLQEVAVGMAGLEQAMRAGPDVSAASQILAQGFPCELLLTNLGDLSSHRFDRGDVKLKALWGPAVLMGFEGEQTVGVTTTNGSLCLLHSSFAPLPLLQRAEQILRSACAAG